MKRLVIIVEGDTERRFATTVLYTHLMQQGITNISTYKIKKTNGGLVNYANLETDIINALYEQNTVVTFLVDYYKIPSNFPDYEKSMQKPTKAEKVEALEKAILDSIQKKKDTEFPNLIPYIQLHEFEALVFCSMDGFRQCFTQDEAKFVEIESIINSYNNPEEINDRPDMAPSIRLANNILGYRKVLHGNQLLENIGINTITDKCPRFNDWINKIITACQ